MDQHEAPPAAVQTCGRPLATRGTAFSDPDWASLAFRNPWQQFTTKSGSPRRDHLDIGFSHFVRGANKATTPHELFDELAAFAEDVGCPWVAYASLTYDSTLSIAGSQYPAILLNYPREWQKLYFERGYHKSDPILWWSRRQAVAFSWSEVYRYAAMNTEKRRVLDEAAVFGLREGISVPLHGPNGRLAIVSFVETQKNGTDECNIAYLQAAAYQFHAIFSTMSTNSQGIVLPDLSRREQECLLWAAEGKSSWDTGMILGISENTVNFHIKNTMRKFGTGSRIVAIVKALRLGLLP